MKENVAQMSNKTHGPLADMHILYICCLVDDPESNAGKDAASQKEKEPLMLSENNDRVHQKSGNYSG